MSREVSGWEHPWVSSNRPGALSRSLNIILNWTDRFSPIPVNKSFLTVRLQIILTGCNVFYIVYIYIIYICGHFLKRVTMLLAFRCLFTCNHTSIIAFSVKEAFKESVHFGYWDIFQTSKKNPKTKQPKLNKNNENIFRSAFMTINGSIKLSLGGSIAMD